MNIISIDRLINKDVLSNRMGKTYTINPDTVTDIEALAERNKANQNHIVESAVALLKKVEGGKYKVVENGESEKSES